MLSIRGIKLGGIDARRPLACRRREISSLRDLVERFAPGGKKKPRRSPDALDAVRFRVTRLTDARAGARSALLEAVLGPAAGEAERERARRRRTDVAWRGLIETVTDEGSRRGDVAKALRAFEEKETERKETLRQALGEWRERQLSAPKGKQESDSYFSGAYVWSWFRKDKKDSSPLKAFAKQLKNERKLFQDLKEAGVDAGTVQRVVSQACASLSANGSGDADDETETTGDAGDGPGSVYVLDFVGDARASGAVRLSEEISAVLSLPVGVGPREVVLRLTSPGGTVTGYGRCAAELARLSGAGVTLTACVDEVAASGGYLMASVAQKVCAGPLAAVGSIGVVATMPNFARRMEDEGVGAVQKTAGRYKRTVTPWKEPGVEELAKLQEDVNIVQKHFVSHLERYRGDKIADLAGVATGEIWYGEDAVGRGLVDEIRTSEDYIAEKIDEGCEVVHVKKIVKRKMSWLSKFGSAVAQDGRLSAADDFWRPTPMFEHVGASMGEDDNLDGENGLGALDDIIRAVEFLPSQERRDLLQVLFRSGR